MHWSLGSSHFKYDLAAGRKFNDSLVEAKKREKELKGMETEKDSTVVAEEEKKTPKFYTDEYKIKVVYKWDISQGTLLLKGGRIISMKGEEVIETGGYPYREQPDQVYQEYRQFDHTRKTRIMDVSGKTIIPGFVDTHAHMWPNWGIHKSQIQMFSAHLA